MRNAVFAMTSPEEMDVLVGRLAYCGYPLTIAGRFASGLDFLTHPGLRSADIAFVDLDLDGMTTSLTLSEFRYLHPLCAWVGVCRPASFSYQRVLAASHLGMCGMVLLPPEDNALREAMDQVMNKLSQIEMRSGLLTMRPIPQEAIDSGQSAELAERIYQFIAKNHVEPLTMADIVNTFFISESYVNRILMKFKKKSFKKILTEMRVQHARELMGANPLLSIGEIAHTVGYTDSHYFSRIYKAFTGASPSSGRGASVNQEEDTW